MDGRSARGVAGDFRLLGFVVDRDGVVVDSQNNPELVGTNLNDLLGADVLGDIPSDGIWVTDPVYPNG